MTTAQDQALETLSVSELKNQLCKVWVKYQRTAQRRMAPLLYFLRKKLKAQGKSGAGFGAWVEDNVDISRRTADRWANAYAVSKGWQKPKKQKAPAFRQVSKSATPNPDGRVTVPLSFVLEQDRADRFWESLQLLGDKATGVIYDAVIAAAQNLKKPSLSVKPIERSEGVGAGQ